jgi:hypothetical protein
MRQWTPEEIEGMAEVAFQEALDQFEELDLDEETLSLEINQQADRIKGGRLSELDEALAWAAQHGCDHQSSCVRPAPPQP